MATQAKKNYTNEYNKRSIFYRFCTSTNNTMHKTQIEGLHLSQVGTSSSLFGLRSSGGDARE